MELINWSLSEIDTIFSSRKNGPGEPACPDGTASAGYTRDAWDKWRVVCLSDLLVEDVEDIYLFGIMMVGHLLIGLGMVLIYRKISKTAACKETPLLSVEIGKHFGAMSDNVKELQRAVKQMEESVRDLTGRAGDSYKKLDYITGQSAEGLRATMEGLCQSAGLKENIEELRRDFTRRRS